MQVGDPEEEIEKVAQAGIRGMVGALGRETISPHVMIDAALHVLAAWVASSQTNSATSEREEEVEMVFFPLAHHFHHRRLHLPPGLDVDVEVGDAIRGAVHLGASAP